MAHNRRLCVLELAPSQVREVTLQMNHDRLMSFEQLEDLSVRLCTEDAENAESEIVGYDWRTHVHYHARSPQSDSAHHMALGMSIATTALIRNQKWEEATDLLAFFLRETDAKNAGGEPGFTALQIMLKNFWSFQEHLQAMTIAAIKSSFRKEIAGDMDETPPFVIERVKDDYLVHRNLYGRVMDYQYLAPEDSDSLPGARIGKNEYSFKVRRGHHRVFNESFVESCGGLLRFSAVPFETSDGSDYIQERD